MIEKSTENRDQRALSQQRCVILLTPELTAKQANLKKNEEQRKKNEEEKGEGEDETTSSN